RPGVAGRERPGQQRGGGGEEGEWEQGGSHGRSDVWNGPVFPCPAESVNRTSAGGKAAPRGVGIRLWSDVRSPGRDDYGVRSNSILTAAPRPAGGRRAWARRRVPGRS